MNRENEAATLLKRDAEWSALASEGKDVDSILSFWTDDAIVIPPELPVVRGRQALREYVEASLQIPGFQISWNSTEVSFSPDGDLAYLTGTNKVSLDGPDASRIESRGRVITIWRRDDDDQWRCCVDIWNAGPTP